MKDPRPSQGARKASKANSREVFTSEATKGRRGKREPIDIQCALGLTVEQGRQLGWAHASSVPQFPSLSPLLSSYLTPSPSVIPSLCLGLSICLYLSIPLGARKVNFVAVPHVAATIDAEK